MKYLTMSEYMNENQKERSIQYIRNFFLDIARELSEQKCPYTASFVYYLLYANAEDVEWVTNQYDLVQRWFEHYYFSETTIMSQYTIGNLYAALFTSCFFQNIDLPKEGDVFEPEKDSFRKYCVASGFPDIAYIQKIMDQETEALLQNDKFKPLMDQIIKVDMSELAELTKNAPRNMKEELTSEMNENEKREYLRCFMEKELTQNYENQNPEKTTDNCISKDASNVIQIIWGHVLERVKQRYDISEPSFKTWIKPLKIQGIDEFCITLLMPDENIGTAYLNKRFYEPLKETIADIVGMGYEIKFVCPKEDMVGKKSSIPLSNTNKKCPVSEKDYFIVTSILNKKYLGFHMTSYYCLDNFSSFTVNYNGHIYKTAEEAYQAQKFVFVPKIYDRIINSASAHEAKRIAHEYESEQRSDWEDVKFAIMEEICTEKAKQHEYIRRKLIETGDCPLAEFSCDDWYWGIGKDEKGLNKLGLIWEKIRKKINEVQN